MKIKENIWWTEEFLFRPGQRVQMVPTCHNCRQTGHLRNQCPLILVGSMIYHGKFIFKFQRRSLCLCDIVHQIVLLVLKNKEKEKEREKKEKKHFFSSATKQYQRNNFFLFFCSSTSITNHHNTSALSNVESSLLSSSSISSSWFQTKKFDWYSQKWSHSNSSTYSRCISRSNGSIGCSDWCCVSFVFFLI